MITQSSDLSLLELCDLLKEISTTFSHTIILWILQVHIFNPHSVRTTYISSNLRALYRSDGQFFFVVIVIIFLKCRSVDLNDLWELSLPKNKFFFFLFSCVKLWSVWWLRKWRSRRRKLNFVVVYLIVYTLIVHILFFSFFFMRQARLNLVILFFV